MKYILLFAALWCNSAKVTAQTAYVASYHFIKPYDTAAFTDDLPAIGEGKHCVKYSVKDTSAIARKQLSIVNRIFLNNCSLKAYCTKDICITEFSSAAHTEVAGVRFNAKQRDSKTAINIEARKEALFIDNKKESCQPIKNNLHFTATGRHKKMGNWECDEYIPVDDTYKGLSVWACADLVTYVHPGFQGAEIKGGIVAVQYDKDQLVLNDLKVATAADMPPIIMDWQLTNKKKIDLFAIGAVARVMR